MALSSQSEFPEVEECFRPPSTEFAQSEGKSRGEVFTKRCVSEFILDLTGWRAGCDLANKRLLEPSCGAGDFLIPAVERLLDCSNEHDPDNLADRILGIEINRTAFDSLWDRLFEMLTHRGLSRKSATRLCNSWLLCDDFLSVPLKTPFSHVVGNPPYLRPEALPKELLRYYRARFSTMYDRSDLYIAFFEKSLSLLSESGRLGFICADRWLKNKYGGPLRDFISKHYHLEVYADFSECDAFSNSVIAYPAVTVISRTKSAETRVIDKHDINLASLNTLGDALISGRPDPRIHLVYNAVSGKAPWLLSNAARLELIQEIENNFPSLERAGCQVGIGVATGADNVFIGTDEEIDVEPERKLPLVTRRDIMDSQVDWHGLYVLNPYNDEGPGLINPPDYPKFQAYIEKHRNRLEQRHVAQKNAATWYKTIDRITPSLQRRPKLLIPDIQGKHQVAFEEGRYYPHHNLYYITSDEWDLRSLQTILRSDLAYAFLATYSLRMRGGYLRFQAQYLRRICIPQWKDLSDEIKEELCSLRTTKDLNEINDTVRRAYNISKTSWKRLRED